MKLKTLGEILLLLTGLAFGQGQFGGGGGGSGSGVSSYPALSNLPVIDVRSYGAVPDGSTDNSTAITNAFTAANAVTTGIPTIYFGCNAASATCQYNYGGSGTSPINPTVPTSIECGQGVYLNYTGSAHAVDLGPAGLSTATLQVQRYTIEGCTFTGGASQTEGIFINNFLIDVLIHKNEFLNFGNTTGANINYTGNNWEMVIDDNIFTSKDATGPRNEIDGHTASNSTIHFTNNIMSCYAAAGGACGVSGQGYGIWTINTAYIINNEIKFHQPLIRISSCQTCGSGTGFYVIGNELEGNSNEPGPAVSFGDPNTAGVAVQTGGVIADNLWFWPGASGVPMVGPETASSSSFNLGSTVFENNFMGPTPTGGAVYVKTNTGNGNRSIHNYGTASGPDLTQAQSPAFFDTQQGSYGTFWYQTSYGSFAWYFQSPQSAVNSSTDYALEAQSGVTRLNAKSGSTGLLFSIDNVDQWKVDPSTFDLRQLGPDGSVAARGYSSCETASAPTILNTGATTTTTGLSCLPANSTIDAVVARVTTTITGSCTGWELGDGTTAARFTSNNTGLTAGTTTDAAHVGTFNNTGINSATTGIWQAAASKITITCAGGNPSAGAIRIIVFYHTWTAPTS